MEEEQIQLLKKFPLLIPNQDFSEYKGYFSVGSSEMYLHTTLPQSPSLAGMTFVSCSWDLHLILQDYQNDVEQWKATSSSFFKFINWLQNVIMTLNQHQTEVEATVPIDAWKNLFRELKIIGLDKVSGADSQNLSWVDLKVTDLADRDHLLRVKLSASSLEFVANLPEVAVKLVQVNETIVNSYQVFEAQVLKMQQFWNMMEEVDAQCWVLDPLDPSPSDTRRQIALDTNVSILINVDPYYPLARPDIKLLGPEAKVEPLQRTIANLVWPKDGSSLYVKLQSALNIEFPSQPCSQNLSQLSQDKMCCICLLAENIDQSCSGCHSIFHLACLKEWLQSIPNNRTSFNRISGTCPQCRGPISCLL